MKDFRKKRIEMLIEFESTIRVKIDTEKNDDFKDISGNAIIPFCEGVYISAQSCVDNCWIDFCDINRIDCFDKEGNKVLHINKSEYDEFVKEREDSERCYECSGYGDDYCIDEDGKPISNCDNCPFSTWNEEKTEERIAPNEETFIQELRDMSFGYYGMDNVSVVDNLFNETDFKKVDVENGRIFIYALNPMRFISNDRFWNYLQHEVNVRYDMTMCIGKYTI